MMSIRVCLAGVTGWAGAALGRAIANTQDVQLVAGIARSQAGNSLSAALQISGLTGRVVASVEEALAVPWDVLVEYTNAEAAMHNVRTALVNGAHAVIGTSGLSDEQLEELGRVAQQHDRGLLAVGNFSLAVLVMQKCAELAARYLSAYEIIDYASAGKIDAPSGTARELAYRLSKIQQPQLEVPLDEVQGLKETRGARLNGVQVHSIRLPGHVISVEALFGLLDQRLSLRYDAGPSPEAYVDGALLAIRKVGALRGLKRGLDSILEV